DLGDLVLRVRRVRRHGDLTGLERLRTGGCGDGDARGRRRGHALAVGLDEVEPALALTDEDDVQLEGLPRVRHVDGDVRVAGQATGGGDLRRGEQLAVRCVHPQLDVPAGRRGDPQEQPVDVDEVDRVVGGPGAVLPADRGAVALDVAGGRGRDAVGLGEELRLADLAEEQRGVLAGEGGDAVATGVGVPGVEHVEDVHV